MKNKYLMDLHTHTIASGHAYNTVNEMIHSAADKGLQLLAITEHAPALPGSCNKFYFQNLNILDRNKYGIKVLYGAEMNIIDLEGNIDMDKRTWQDLDLCIASMHLNCMEPGTIEENTHAYITAMSHPKVSIIGHPDDSRIPIDYEKLIKTAKEKHILIELNNSSMNPKGFRLNTKENDLTLLKICKKYGVCIALGSDAHREEDIGNFSLIQPLIDEVGFPEHLIVNTSFDLLQSYLK